MIIFFTKMNKYHLFQMEDIAIPMLHGNMEDINGDSTNRESEANESASTQKQYERESRITIDYSSLPENLKDIEEEDLKKTTDGLNKGIHELQNKIQRIQAPNMKAIQKLYLAKEKLQETNEEFEQLRKKAKKAKTQFEKVKKERYDRFTTCFEHVSNEIDAIYKVIFLISYSIPPVFLKIFKIFNLYFTRHLQKINLLKHFLGRKILKNHI